jgi:hypothetical protein
MSKLLENKQLIHIVSEVLILFVIVFYFSSKNRKLQTDIEHLAQKLEEQGEHLQKLEHVVRNIDMVLRQKMPLQPPRKAKIEQKMTENKMQQVRSSQPASSQQVPSRPPRPQVVEIEEEPYNEDELDGEIEEELQELNDDDNEEVEKNENSKKSG